VLDRGIEGRGTHDVIVIAGAGREQ
jgi:hypothetical protein